MPKTKLALLVHLVGQSLSVLLIQNESIVKVISRQVALLRSADILHTHHPPQTVSLATTRHLRKVRRLNILQRCHHKLLCTLHVPPVSAASPSLLERALPGSSSSPRAEPSSQSRALWPSCRILRAASKAGRDEEELLHTGVKALLVNLSADSYFGLLLRFVSWFSFGRLLHHQRLDALPLLI